MKLYKTTSTNAGGQKYAEFASSADGASKIRTRLKKANHSDIGTKEVDILTDRTGLIIFLNDLTASEGWAAAPTATKLEKS